MKKNMFLAAAMLVAMGAQGAIPAEPRMISVDVNAQALFPHESYWDEACGGAEFGLTLWLPASPIGLRGAIGAQGYGLEWNNGEVPLDTDIVTMPFGGDLVVDVGQNYGLGLRLAGGARYVAIDVDDWDDDYYRRHHRDWAKYWYDAALDIDDTWVAVASAQLVYNAYPFTLGIGGGYQWDIEKPDVSYRGEKFAEADFSAGFFMVTLGLTF